MLDEAKMSKGHNIIVEILIFLLVFIVIEILSSLPVVGIDMVAIMSSDGYKELTSEYQQGVISMDEYVSGVSALQISGDMSTILSLAVTGVATLLTIVYCRFIEKRKVSSMGFRRSNFLREYLVGMLVGTVMFSAAVGICLITGGLSFAGAAQNIRWGYIGLYFVGFLIQGMSEETILRGYFMVSLSRRAPVAAAVLISSVLFACAHLLNPGVSALAIVNLILFGMFAAVYILKRGNIWGACGIHSLWNFVQGNFFGIKVSGLDGMDTVLQMTSVENKAMINGGDFGLEGGIAVTIVLAVSIAAVLLTKTKQDELSEETAVVTAEAAA